MDYAASARDTFENLLGTLDNLAKKTQAAGIGKEVLGAKLAEDMFPLETQFRIAINQVLLALIRVASVETPLDETPYEDFAEIRDRLAGVRALAANAVPSSWQEAGSTVDFTLPNDMRFVMTAEEYIRDWILPNFYFHVSIAYALLRREGLELGKADFLPHMLKYARSPAA